MMQGRSSCERPCGPLPSTRGRMDPGRRASLTQICPLPVDSHVEWRNPLATQLPLPISAVRTSAPSVLSAPSDQIHSEQKTEGPMRALALKTVSLLALATLSSIMPTPAARAEDGTDEQFGKVHFQTSCNEVAQRRFDRGMRYQHSFWYRPAKEIFEETLQADPECAIAYWGIALSLLYNPHFPAPKENLTEGLTALQKAKALGAKSDRERDYIDALLAFYSGDEQTKFGERAKAYLKTTEAIAARYPDDDEAQIGYAIMLNVAASPNDKTYAKQLKGAAILEPIFKRQPRHPGIAHYLIHLYDYPAIAEKGLDAAQRYAGIAPAAPHAQHMPSHIFTRVGYWKESITSNDASARSAKAAKEFHDQLHAMDYLVYAYLQLAHDKEARAAIDEMVSVKGYNPNVR